MQAADENKKPNVMGRVSHALLSFPLIVFLPILLFPGMKNDTADRAEDLENNEAARSIVLAVFLLVSLSIALLLSFILLVFVCIRHKKPGYRR